jgi:hypothetical protein
MRGPIDYIIVGFEGNTFDGSILHALSEAIESDIIALVALAFIRKDKDGTVEQLDVANLGDKYAITFVEKYAQDGNDVAAEDVDEMAELLENDTAAGLLIIEQLWAKPLKEAMLKANGVLVAEGRIHPDAVAELSNEGGK